MVINFHGWPKSAYVVDKFDENKGVGQVSGGDQCYCFVTWKGMQERAHLPDTLRPAYLSEIESHLQKESAQ